MDRLGFVEARASPYLFSHVFCFVLVAHHICLTNSYVFNCTFNTLPYLLKKKNITLIILPISVYHALPVSYALPTRGKM